jgi:DNA-binding protein YbaB
MAGDPDLSALQDRLARLSADLEQAASALAGLQYEVFSTDRMVHVVVDGIPRVLSLTIDPRALRLGPDALDRSLTESLNQALASARTATAEGMLSVLPPDLRQHIEVDE